MGVGEAKGGGGWDVGGVVAVVLQSTVALRGVEHVAECCHRA